VFLEELVGAGTVFAAVERDRSVVATDLLPVLDLARENSLTGLAPLT